MNRKLALALAGAATLSVLAVVALVLVNRSTPLSQPEPASPTPSTEKPAATGETVLSEPDMAALSLVIQQQMGLEGALVSKRGDVLELRFADPNLSASETVVLYAGLFDWLDRAAPEGEVSNIRIVMTLAGADAAFAQASRADIRTWRAGGMTSEAFIASWDRVSLIATE